MREHLMQAFLAGIQAVQPDRAIRQFVEPTEGGCKIANRLYSTADLRILTVGKAAVAMAATLADLFGDRVRQGLVVSPQVGQELPATWRVVIGNHPLPDTGSLAAGQAVHELLAYCTADTLLLVGVSGGATALLIDPPPEISLATLRSIYQTLLTSGADITEMNAVRSRLDRLKAGGLVDLAAPAQVAGLILSDVVGDDMAIIGSGLTARPTAHNILIGSNRQACIAAADVLDNLGYQTQIVTTQMTGVAKIQGKSIAQAIQLAAPGTALIYGGETTVALPVDCPGLGGRNQELVLAAAIALGASAAIALQDYLAPVWIGSIGTDGIDGQSPAAGAIVETQTWQIARAQKIMAEDYLDRHDSYHFFERLGQLVMLGATGTNVADLSIALKPR